MHTYHLFSKRISHMLVSNTKSMWTKTNHSYKPYYNRGVLEWPKKLSKYHIFSQLLWNFYIMINSSRSVCFLDANLLLKTKQQFKVTREKTSLSTLPMCFKYPLMVPLYHVYLIDNITMDFNKNLFSKERCRWLVLSLAKDHGPIIIFTCPFMYGLCQNCT